MDIFLGLWNTQWFHSISILLTMLGTMYLAVDFLDDKFIVLKVIAQGISFGLVVALFYTLPIILTRIILHFISHFMLIFVGYFGFSSFGYVFSSSQIDSVMFNGLVFGVIVGTIYIIIRKFNKFNFIKYLPLIAVFLLIFSFIWYYTYTEDFLYGPIQYFLGAVVLADLSGFSFGIVIASKRITWWKNIVIGFVCLILVILFILLLLTHLPANEQLFVAMVNLFAEVFYGFLFGVALSNWLQKRKEIEQTSFVHFISWLVLGITVGTLSFLILSNPTATNLIGTRYIFGELAYFAFVALGIINGRGGDLIKKIYPAYRLKYINNNLYPLVNWKRLIYGFIIGIFYGATFLCYNLIAFFYFFLRATPDKNITLSLGLTISLVYMFAICFIVGIVYGFGPMIMLIIENFDKRKLGQLGLILAFAGIIMGQFVH